MKKAKIGIASDHAGYLYKHVILTELEDNDLVDVLDLGVHSEKSADYPDVALKIAEAIQKNKIDKGILICGSGVGVSIAANKFLGIRAAVCHDVYSAHQGVEHDDMNVLCLGQRIIGIKHASEIVHHFLEATFSPSESHLRRVAKVLEIEAENMKEML